MTATATSIWTARKDFSVGVVFTTYNRPHDLARVLAGYARQSHSQF